MANLHPVLRDRVQRILMSPACQAIDFSFARAHIDGSGYMYVALALVAKDRRGGGLNIRTRSDGYFVPPPARAQYDPEDNLLVFKDESVGLTAREEALTVHECTHALIDAQKQSIGAISNEICAYLAGSLYNSNLPNPGPPNHPIHVAADNLATIVKANGKTRKPNVVTPVDVSDLRAAIRAAPPYRFRANTPQPHDGLPLGPR